MGGMGGPRKAGAQSVVAHLANGYIFPHQVGFFLSGCVPVNSSLCVCLCMYACVCVLEGESEGEVVCVRG